MDWTIEPTTERYTLASGSCSATVWNSGRHGYAAKVSTGMMNTAQYGFNRLEDAQAWCLKELADLRVAGRCQSAGIASDGGGQ